MRLPFYDISAKKSVTLTVKCKRTLWKGTAKRYIACANTKDGKTLSRFVKKEVYDKI